MTLRRQRRRVPGALAVLWLLGLGSPGFAGDETLFYEVRDGIVVFTNTPTAEAKNPGPARQSAPRVCSVW